MEIIRKLLVLMIFVISVPAFSADHTVEMLSSSNGQMMVFKPAVLQINPGDTVTWKATNPGHNTASINEMSPDSSLQWDGKINEELKITFTKEGVYGYKCTPHYILVLAYHARWLVKLLAGAVLIFADNSSQRRYRRRFCWHS